MARLIINKNTKPFKMEVGGETKWICRCGLSKKDVLCDGSHNQILDEDPDSVYSYSETGEKREVMVKAQQKCNCGKGGCC